MFLYKKFSHLFGGANAPKCPQTVSLRQISKLQLISLLEENFLI